LDLERWLRLALAHQSQPSTPPRRSGSCERLLFVCFGHCGHSHRPRAAIQNSGSMSALEDPEFQHSAASCRSRVTALRWAISLATLRGCSFACCIPLITWLAPCDKHCSLWG